MSPITGADAEAAIPIAQAPLDTSIYEARIQRVTNQERQYMRAMAEIGEARCRSPGASSAVLMESAITRLLERPTRVRLLDHGNRTPDE
jgi:hypothetical protein